MGCVYFIACTETKRVKIGYTKGKPEARLRALQTGASGVLTLIEYQPGTPATEKRLHQRFEKSRLHGEWFKPTEELYEYLVALSVTNAKMALETGAKVSKQTKLGVAVAVHAGFDVPEEVQEMCS